MRKRFAVPLCALALAALITAGAFVFDSRRPVYQAAPEPPSKLKPEEYEKKSQADLLKLARAGDWGAVKHLAETNRRGPESDKPGRLLREYAKAGYNEARYRLAEIHSFNARIKGDLFDGADFLHAPVESIKRIQKIIEFRRKRVGEFDSQSSAIALWQEAADGGHAPSQSLLGHRYFSGEELPKDIPRALSLLERAARGGDVRAAATMAKLHYQGSLVPRDDAKCAEYMKLTKQGPLIAALLVLNRRGEQSEIPAALKALDPEEAANFHWNEGPLAARVLFQAKPASTAPACAANTLGYSTTTKTYDGLFHQGASTWFDGKADEHKGVHERAERYFLVFQETDTGECLHDAQAGDMFAQHVLGWTLLNKPDDSNNLTDTATDAEKAEGVEWLRKSAKQGFTAAMVRLAQCVRDGKGVKPDRVEAAYWFTLATSDLLTDYRSERDHALAALTPEERARVARRVAEARRAFALAVRPKLEEQAKSGDPETLFELALLRVQLAPDGRADAGSLALLESAAGRGHLPALRALGLHRLCADDAHRDLPGALASLDRAARAGDAAAAATLTRVYYQGKLMPRDDARCLEYAKLTKSPTLVAALVLLNGRGDKAASDEALKGIAPFKDYSGGNTGALWRARIMLRTKPAASAPEWASWRLRGSTFTAADYDAACSGTLANWFDRPIEEFLQAGVFGDAYLGGADAPAPTGTCLRDAEAGDMIAQHVLGHDFLAQAAAFASAGDAARADALRKEATDWLRRSAAQGFTAAMETLAELHRRDSAGVKPDKVEVAYWLSLATTDFYKPNSEARDKALATLSEEERAAVVKRVAEARRALAARRGDRQGA